MIPASYTLATLDPHAETTFGSHEILSNIYEPLVALGPHMKVQQSLASSWESPDPLTWVFHLRTGVRFHTGRALDAEDVVFTVERLLNEPQLQVRSYMESVSAAEAKDARTVVLRTRLPQPLLPSGLAFVLIVPRGATATYLSDRTDGTGPYMLGERRPRMIRLERNERYWGPKPEIREAAFRLGTTAEDAVAGMLGGQYRLMTSPWKGLASALGNDPRFRIARRENYFVRYLGFDVSRHVTPFSPVVPNPFLDHRVRLAVHLGIDRRRLVGDLPINAVPASQLVPPAIFGFDPSIHEPAPDTMRAAALLRDAGLGRGFDVALHVSEPFQDVAELIHTQLAPLGIRITVKPMPSALLFEALARHEATSWIASFGCSSGDIEELLTSSMHSPDSSRRLGAVNYGGLQDREVDSAIDAVLAQQNPRLRLEAAQSVMRRLMDALVWIPLYHDTDVYAVHKSLAWEPRDDAYIRLAEIRASTYAP